MNEKPDIQSKRIRFTPEISLGNVLQLLSVVAGVIGLWLNMDKRITAVEMREAYAVEERGDMRKTLVTLADNQALLTRTVDRMSVWLDVHARSDAKADLPGFPK